VGAVEAPDEEHDGLAGGGGRAAEGQAVAPAHAVAAPGRGGEAVDVHAVGHLPGGGPAGQGGGERGRPVVAGREQQAPRPGEHPPPRQPVVQARHGRQAPRELDVVVVGDDVGHAEGVAGHLDDLGAEEERVVQVDEVEAAQHREEAGQERRVPHPQQGRQAVHLHALGRSGLGRAAHRGP
jgi:hypothetical protein